MTRALNPDRVYTASDGGTLTLPGRSLMLVRNVGHLMTIDAVTRPQGGSESPRASSTRWSRRRSRCTTLQRTVKSGNSRAGSVYIVKPKMHGPEEVAFAGELFDRVEAALGLPRNTLKIGIMDEERRTHAQPEGMHPRGDSDRVSSSSTPASSIAPATKSTRPWKPGR